MVPRKIRRMTLLACAALSVAAQAQGWPTKPVRLIVPFAPGGSTDNVARLIAERLPSQIGQQVIVDNRSGANGAVGTAVAAGANADGYNFLAVFDSHATNPSLQKTLPFDTLKDFAPVMLIATSPMALVVHAQSPYRNLNDLIAAARAKPGALVLASGGIGSRGHLAMAVLEGKAGFKITQVAYKGTAQVTNAVLSRETTMQMGTVYFVAPFVKAQRLRALAVTTPTRIPQLPDVPTVAEQGFPGYEVQAWWGIVAPSATPAAIIRRMNAELQTMLATPDLQQRLGNLGMTVRASGSEEFGRFIVSEMELWGKVVREAKISASGD